MLIDTHCHFPDERYGKSEDEIVKEALDAGVAKLINIGTNLKDNEKVLATLQKFPNVYAALGIYPHEELKNDLADLMIRLEKQLDSSEKVVGVGECGIDISDQTEQRPIEEQIELFEKQIELATKKNKALVVHNRNGDDIVLNILEKFRGQNLTGVAHCFVSTWEVAKRFLDLGFYISFSGIITYKSGSSIHETVKNVPLDKFLLETDAPFLPPQLPDRHRPKVNEPKYVKITASKVSEVKNLPLEEIENLSYQNSCELFRIKERLPNEVR